MNDDEYQCALDDAAAFGFWSGVRACMLVEARAAYLEEARAVWWALDTGREIYEEDTGPFWLAVAALQRLGEVGGSPWPGGEP